MERLRNQGRSISLPPPKRRSPITGKIARASETRKALFGIGKPSARPASNTGMLRNAHRSPAMMGVPAVLTCALAHGRLQRTALCARKIVVFLKVGIGSTAGAIYWCAAADAQSVGRQPSFPSHYGAKPNTSIDETARDRLR
jgi:hypothetical protein